MRAIGILLIIGVAIVFAFPWLPDIDFPAATYGALPFLSKQNMPMIVSLIVLVAGLAVIFFKNDPVDKHWAFTSIGAIIGYWFKAAT